jgi:hypothetical protein
VDAAVKRGLPHAVGAPGKPAIAASLLRHGLAGGTSGKFASV